MTHTLAAERAWRRHAAKTETTPPPGDDVKSIAYFCGVLPETEIAAARRSVGADASPRAADRDRRIAADLQQRARKYLRTFLRRRTRAIWPNEKQPLTRLAKADGTANGNVGDQVVQVNASGSDRYTLALPGSLEFRISPLDETVVNMTLAGDWTECGFNEGCIEAAVMSGMLAAHAISGKPDLDDIIGYNHP